MRIIFLVFCCILYLFAHNEEYSPIKPIPYDKDLANLGKYLYFDINLSPNKVSCNSCHDLNLTGSGSSNSGFNTDGLKNPPTILNIANASLYFSDGSVTDIYEQVRKTLLNEMHLNKILFQQIINNNIIYKDLFKKAKVKPTYDNLILAFVEFEKSLTTLNSSFDSYIMGDENAISEQAKKGFKLFKKYGCSSCHNGNNFGTNIVANINQTFSNLCGNNSGLVKVPTLRNITLSAPYAYNGMYENLEDIIRVMSICQLGIVMPDNDVSDIIEFLKTLEGKKPVILD